MSGNRFGEIDHEFMEWFGMKDHIGSMSEELPDNSPNLNVLAEVRGPMTSHPALQYQTFDGMINMEGLFDLGFDMSLPLMTGVCGTEDAFAQGYSN